MEAFMQFFKGDDTVSIYEIRDNGETRYRVTHERPNYSMSTWYDTAREAKDMYDIIIGQIRSRGNK